MGKMILIFFCSLDHIYSFFHFIGDRHLFPKNYRYLKHNQVHTYIHTYMYKYLTNN